MTKPVKLAFLFAGVLASCVVVGLGLETAANNATGWLLVLIGLTYCIASCIQLAIARRRRTITVGLADRSLWLIAPGLLVGLMAPPLESLYLKPLLPHGAVPQMAGGVLVGAGLVLGLWAWRARHAAEGAVREKRAGLYQFLRCPGYVALGLMALGVGVGYGSAIGLAGNALLFAPGLIYRMGIEEKTTCSASGRG